MEMLHMMISPDDFMKQIKEYSFEKLLTDRDKVISDLKSMEEGECDANEYKGNLEYLAMVSVLLLNKYHEKLGK